jgi:hypothetical protein
VADPVKVIEQLPPDNLQLVLLNDPDPATRNVTFPLGTIGVPVSVSVTEALHVEAWLTTTGLEHASVVDVVRGSTVMVAGELELWPWA